MAVEAVEIRERERQFELQRRLQEFPLDDQGIWLSVIAAVSSRRLDKFLRFDEAVEIVDTLTGHYQNGNVSVAEVVTKAGIVDLTGASFLTKVAFNFDYQPGASERWNAAMEEVQQHKRPFIDASDPEFRTLEEFTKEQLSHTIRSGWFVREMEIFNQTDQKPETVYELTGNNPSNLKKIMGEILSFPLMPTWPLMILAGDDFFETDGWRYVGRLRKYYYEEALPLLADDELVKPEYPGWYNVKTVVVKKST